VTVSVVVVLTLDAVTTMVTVFEPNESEIAPDA
jgi:hypothetical protein